MSATPGPCKAAILAGWTSKMSVLSTEYTRIRSPIMSLLSRFRLPTSRPELWRLPTAGRAAEAAASYEAPACSEEEQRTTPRPIAKPPPAAKSSHKLALSSRASPSPRYPEGDGGRISPRLTLSVCLAYLGIHRDPINTRGP